VPTPKTTPTLPLPHPKRLHLWEHRTVKPEAEAQTPEQMREIGGKPIKRKKNKRPKGYQSCNLWLNCLRGMLINKEGWERK